MGVNQEFVASSCLNAELQQQIKDYFFHIHSKAKRKIPTQNHPCR
jgi:hypothetical protein